MSVNKVDLILHPVRMRIIRALVGKSWTVQQIAKQMPDIPQATLYRHLKKLLAGGILEVVSENPVRGTVEKVYELSADGGKVSPEEFLQADAEDHMRFFTSFVAGLLNDYWNYLQQEEIDFMQDGVGYSYVTLFMNDEELKTFSEELVRLVTPLLANQPGAERRARVFSTMMIPLTAVDEGDAADEQE